MSNDFKDEALRLFNSINGWIELGNYEEAAKELMDLHPRFKSSVEYLKAWVQIYTATKAWTNVEVMCETLIKHAPGDPFGFLHMAEALHQQKKHINAIEVLGSRLDDDDWRESPVVLYALARYFCAVNQFMEARECLRKAIDEDKAFRKKSLDDPDLEKLWISND